MGRIDDLIRNGTGYSSKNFALVLGILTVFITAISIIALLFVDMFSPRLSISSDMVAMAQLILALDVLVGWFFWQKVRSEKYEFNNKKNE